MHEKKAKRLFRGLSKELELEIENVLYDSAALQFMVDVVLGEMERDSSDMADIQSAWLNSPYSALLHVEDRLAKLEAEVNADAQFSDKVKQSIWHEAITPTKEVCRQVHELDACVMLGMPLPSDIPWLRHATLQCE